MRTRTPATSDLSSVLATSEKPCVSIYMPTARSYPDSQGDPVHYRDLVRRAEEALAKTYPGPVAREVAHRLHEVEGDAEVWGHSQGSVAVLASPGRLEVFTLPRPVPERAEVGETFHVKPLLRHAQSADRFHVLGLSRERVALFQGNRYEMAPLTVPGLPMTLTDALGEETDDPVRRFHTAGGPSVAGQGPGPMVRGHGAGQGALIGHGQGARKEEILPDVHRFFRAVDRVIIEKVSEPSRLPLIPVGIDDNLSEFRAVSKNRFVTEDGVSADWTRWTLNEIREKAWKVFEKRYLAQLAAIREDYGTAAARGLGTDDLGEAARAAATGRVGILLIDGDRILPGSLDMATGEPRPATGGGAAAGDMLDDLAELGLSRGANVVVTHADQMPTKTGLAAIFRY